AEEAGQYPPPAGGGARNSAGTSLRLRSFGQGVAPPAHPNEALEGHMKRSIWSVIVGVLAWAAIGAAARADELSKATAAFERLASLVGGWKGVQDGTEFQVIYTLTANNSALMEEFRPKDGPTMVTMFTVDGDHLLATHYCAAKNQPQMATGTIGDPQAKSLAFDLVRVTGLRSPGAWHNTALIVTMEDRDHVTQEWTYLFGEKSG